MAGYKKSKVPAWKRKAGARKGKRRAGYKTISLVGKSLNPIPQRMIVKHKYATTVNPGFIGSPETLHQFNLNSMWDPDRTGIGRQPYGRDTYALLYSKYRVISCSWRVAGLPSNSARVIQVAVVPTNQSSPAINMAEVRELPRCKYVIQQPNAPQQFCSGKTYIPSLMGRTKAQYMADDTYAAAISASPSELALLNIYAGSFTDDNITGESVYFNVEMEFTVEWFDPAVLPSS